MADIVISIFFHTVKSNLIHLTAAWGGLGSLGDASEIFFSKDSVVQHQVDEVTYRQWGEEPLKTTLECWRSSPYWAWKERCLMACRLSAVADESSVSFPLQQCAVKLIKLLQNSVCTWANNDETACVLSGPLVIQQLGKCSWAQHTTRKSNLWDRILNRSAENRSQNSKKLEREDPCWRALLRSVTGKYTFEEVTFTSLRTKLSPEGQEIFYSGLQWMMILRKLLQLFAYAYGALDTRKWPHKISEYWFIGVVDSWKA